jgi:hypothetical protein
MNLFHLARFAWKEARTVGPAWATVCGLALGVQLLASRATAPEQVPELLFWIAAAFTACYAIACGAILFASELEERSNEFLASLPISPISLLTAKFTCGLASLFAMSATLCASAWLMSARDVLRGTTFMAFVCLFGIESYAWSALCSMTARRVFSAMALAVLCVFSISLVAGSRVFDFGAVRGVLLGVVLVTDVWLAGRWAAGRGWKMENCGGKQCKPSAPTSIVYASSFIQTGR